MRVTVVGAGAVGTSCTEYIAIKDFASEVTLIDIRESLTEGKAVDLMQTAPLNGFDIHIAGVTSDYIKTVGSDVAVTTSDIPRKPDMTHEELVGINANIVKSIVEQLVKYSLDMIVTAMNNPTDAMAYLVHKATNLPKNYITGVGGVFGSACFKYRLAKVLNSPILDVDGMAIAARSDSSISPLTRLANYREAPVTEPLSANRLNQVAEDTKVGGATLTKLLGTSAWYAPETAVSALVQTIACDQKKFLPCSVLFEGEYGEKDVCAGVPVIVDRDGVKKIVEVELSDAKKTKFTESTAIVHEVDKVLTGVL